MTVSVTQDHINQGIRGSCTSCPVALALGEAGFSKSYVGPYQTSVRRLGIFPKRVRTPEAVRDFLMRFDNSLSVQPFEFEVEL